MLKRAREIVKDFFDPELDSALSTVRNVVPKVFEQERVAVALARIDLAAKDPDCSKDQLGLRALEVKYETRFRSMFPDASTKAVDEAAAALAKVDYRGFSYRSVENKTARTSVRRVIDEHRMRGGMVAAVRS